MVGQNEFFFNPNLLFYLSHGYHGYQNIASFSKGYYNPTIILTRINIEKLKLMLRGSV